MKDLTRRIQRLEASTQSHDVAQTEGNAQSTYKFWAMEMEWTALSLVRGVAPGFTLDEEGAFFTLDGRFALSMQRMDLQALMGPQTEKLRESIPLEWWGEFLNADEEAANLRERLQSRADSVAVPEDFELPMEDSHAMREIRERIGDPHGLGGSVFLSPEEKEATRYMTYALLHDAESRVILSTLTRRREAFTVADGGGGYR